MCRDYIRKVSKKDKITRGTKIIIIGILALGLILLSVVVGLISNL